jgi:hypothetical protein
MRFAVLLRKTGGGSHRRHGNRIWRATSAFASIFSLSSFPRKRESIHPPALKPEMDSRWSLSSGSPAARSVGVNDRKKFHVLPRAWSRTARRRYDWMR